MKLVIEVIENHHLPFEISGIGKTSGKPYSFFKQKCYAHIGGAFPVEFEIMLDDARNAYAVGKYDVDANSFEVDARGNIAFGRTLVLHREEKTFNKVA
jgi:hypothetical protein